MYSKHIHSLCDEKCETNINLQTISMSQRLAVYKLLIKCNPWDY